MITNAITLLMLCIFAFIPLLLGEYARNRSILTTEDFILQGRKMKAFPMYATVFSTWMSVFAFMGAISYFYEQGPIYMTTIGWDALFAVLFIVIGRRIWHYGKSYSYMTPTDFFDDIYDSKVLSILVTTIIIVYTMIYLGLFLMNTAGGTEKVFNELIRRDELNVSMNLEDGGLRVAMWLSLFVIVPIGAFMGPQMWIRNYAAISEKNFNILPLLLCVSSVICIGTLFAGSASAVLAENVTNPEAILIEMVKKYANPFLYVFVIVGIYATIFSTANSQIHALSAVYTIDIHKKYINSKTPDKKLVAIAKWGVLFISAVSYILIILIPKSIFELAVMALGGLAQLFIPVLGALFWKKSTAKAAIAGLITGECLFLTCVIFKVADTSICAVASLVMNMFVFVTVSCLDKHRITVSKKIETYMRDYKRKNY